MTVLAVAMVNAPKKRAGEQCQVLQMLVVIVRAVSLYGFCLSVSAFIYDDTRVSLSFFVFVLLGSDPVQILGFVGLAVWERMSQQNDIVVLLSCWISVIFIPLGWPGFQHLNRNIFNTCFIFYFLL